MSRVFWFCLFCLPLTSPAKMTWEEMKDPNSYNNFTYQVLQWTNLFQAQQNYVALTDDALRSLEFWRVHLAAEKSLNPEKINRPNRGLASAAESPVQTLDEGAYQAWQGQQSQNQMPVSQTPTQPTSFLCRPNESCLSEGQFYGQPRELTVNPTAEVAEARPIPIPDIQVIIDQTMTPNEHAAYLEELRQMGRDNPNQEPESPFGFGTQIPVSQGLNEPQDNRYVLDPTQGDYQQRGNYIYQCHPGRGCNEVIGPITEFRIGMDVGEVSHGQVMTDPGSSESSPQHSYNSSTSPSHSRNSSTNQIASAMTQAFQRCESNYQKALQLCGSSFQGANNEAVQGELNLRSGMAMAQYLQMARAASQTQGKSMYEICDTTEKMARSMTALNAAYTAICSSAQNSCASSCSQADSYLQSSQASDADVTAALNATSRNFDPARYYTVCKGDMNQQMTQGIFQTAQTAQMMAQANQCKSQIAASGPCALPEMWNSQACADHCKDPKNAYEPACARFTAMNSNCSNPEFAQKNPMCLCINNPSDPSCGSGGLIPDDEIAGGGNGWNPSVGRGGVPTSSGVGSFGSQQAYQGGAARGGQASSSSQGAFPGGGAGGPILGSGSSGGGGGAGQQAAGGPRASGYKTGIIDGVQNYGGSRRGAQAQQRRRVVYGDMNSRNPYRRIAVQTDDPDFDLKKYLPPEDYEAGKVRKCYYGNDRIGCMHGPSLFDMVSRQYRKIRHQMMP